MKRVVAVLMLLLCPIDLYAKVVISLDHRIANQAPGFCLWCSIEMLGLTHKRKELEGLAQYYKDWRYEVWDEDNEVWVKKPYPRGHSLADGAAQIEHLGCKATNINVASIKDLRSICDRNIGCVVSLKWWKPVAENAPTGYHAVVVTDVTDTDVYFVDCNHPAELYVVSIDWFKDYWTGQMLIVWPATE